MGVRAIDVSVWQGRVDWRAVADSGVRGVWIKVGGADNPQDRNRGLYKDSRADENLAGATAAGLAVGTYFWCRPGGAASAREQAEFAVACGHGQGALWPGADLESNPHGLSHVDYDGWASDFCGHVQRITDVPESLAYTFTGAGVLGYSSRAPAHCPLWIANYGANRPGTTPPSFSPGLPPAWARWHVWQFNDQTRIPGITANTVDQNVVADDLWWLMIASSVRRKTMQGTATVDINEAGVPGLWRYIVDGFGIERRVHVDSPAAQRTLARIGVIDSVDTPDGPAPAAPVVLHGEEAQWFAALEPANDSRQSAEWATIGILRAVVGQVLDERGLRVEADPGGPPAG